MPAHVGPIDPARRIDIDIVGLSAHAIAFALWWRAPGRDDWTVVGQGRTGDSVTDPRTFSLDPLPRAQIYYWLAASNPARPHTVYHARIRLGQAGTTLPHGEIDLRGTTDSAGNDSVEEWIDLL